MNKYFVLVFANLALAADICKYPQRFTAMFEDTFSPFYSNEGYYMEMDTENRIAKVKVDVSSPPIKMTQLYDFNGGKLYKFTEAGCQYTLHQELTMVQFYIQENADLIDSTKGVIKNYKQSVSENYKQTTTLWDNNGCDPLYVIISNKNNDTDVIYEQAFDDIAIKEGPFEPFPSTEGCEEA